MVSDVGRKRLITVALSLVVGWHTLAIVIAPAPETGPMVLAIRGVVAPYLTLFGLDNQWSFYAPNVGRGHVLGYLVENAAGERRSFVPTDDLSGYHPAHWKFRARYDSIADDVEEHGEQMGVELCRKHAALRPVAVTLMKLQEEEFSPADQLSGKRPIDPEFFSVRERKRVPCPYP